MGRQTANAGFAEYAVFRSGLRENSGASKKRTSAAKAALRWGIYGTAEAVPLTKEVFAVTQAFGPELVRGHRREVHQEA